MGLVQKSTRKFRTRSQFSNSTTSLGWWRGMHVHGKRGVHSIEGGSYEVHRRFEEAPMGLEMQWLRALDSGLYLLVLSWPKARNGEYGQQEMAQQR